MRKKTIEDYVEVLYALEKVERPVHTTKVANALNINPASVTEIFQKLADEGYLIYQKYSGVELTDRGKRLAITTQKKHDVLKQMLILLGVDAEVADQDACLIEHVVHAETVDKLTKFVSFTQEEGSKRWLDHFSHYDKTGDYIECTPYNELDCPIHSPRKKSKRDTVNN